MTENQKELIKKLYEEAFPTENSGMDKIKVEYLKLKDNITIGDKKWTVIKKCENGDAYILLDEPLCDSVFGDNNNYNQSAVRKILQESELLKSMIDELSENAFVGIELDLWSHDGLRDYGVCKGDVLGLLTYDMYRDNRENINNIDSWWWLATPDSTPSGAGANYVRYVGSRGFVDCDGCDWRDGAVRPFCILKSDIFVSSIN